MTHGPFFHVTQNEKDICPICHAQAKAEEEGAKMTTKLELNAYPAQCGCRKAVDATLLPHNTMLSYNMLDPDPCFVLTTKIKEKVRGKPMLVAATYCPFCGKRYRKSEGASVGGSNERG